MNFKEIPLQSANIFELLEKVRTFEADGYECKAPIKKNRPRATHVNDGKYFYFVKMIKKDEIES